MGHAYAAGLAESVTEHGITFEGALRLHLTDNFYPPLPAGYAAPLAEAIEAVREDDGATLVALPDVALLPRTAERIEGVWMVDADALVEVCRAWAFV